MQDTELYSLGGMNYTSHAMFDRRRRILNEARKMLADRRLDEFNIRELSRRSAVAQGTIYNAFTSKENVIALAIRQYYEAFSDKISYVSDPASFEGVLERAVTGFVRDQQVRNYMQAITAIYFSPTAPLRIRNELVELGVRPVLPWLEALRLERQIEKGIDIRRFAANLANLKYSIVQEWGAGAIPDDRFVICMMEAMLIFLGGAVKGKARSQIRTHLIDLQNNGPLSTALLDGSGAKIAKMLDSVARGRAAAAH